MSEVQVDLRAYMATLETTHKPLVMCPSCQRALLYAAMAYAGSVQAQIEKATKELSRYRPSSAMDALVSAAHYTTPLLQALVEFCRVDFIGAMEGAEELSPEDWSNGIASFYSARVDHYVDEETGEIRFEPHDEEDTPYFPEPDDGVPAK
jgi:hypothetical protein